MEGEESWEEKLEQIPEGCIADIISWTSPLDACRSTAVSKSFQSAADSDIVWEHFLPSDYQEIISKSTTPVIFFSKKELYLSLCDSPILVDNGTKSFSLDKASGKKCYLVGARELSIAWRDEPHYWSWVSDPRSRFTDVANLNNVCWFDIIGHIQTRILSPNTTYAAYLVFNFGAHDYGFHQLFKSYVTVLRQDEVGDAGDENNFKPVYLRPRGSVRRFRRYGIPQVSEEHSSSQEIPRERPDGWMEIEMGGFATPDDDEFTFVRMQLKEVEALDSKSGIIVEGIEVRPKCT